jgi:cobalt-zinc-cadmium efflux system outer membrane protein
LRPRSDAAIDAATAMLAAGRGTVADGIAAKAARATLEDRIDEATRGLEDARADLVRWLPTAEARPLGDAADWSNLGADPDTLIAGIAHHRELLAYDADERAANADIALARAEKRPDWSVELDYAQRGPRYSNMVSLEFRVGLPIFAAQRQDPSIASKEAAAARIEAEREDARRMHAAELRKTLAAWRSAGDRARRYQRELLPLADDRADAAIAAYRGGRGDLPSVLAAFDQAVEARIADAELENTYGQAWAALHFAFPEER